MCFEQYICQTCHKLFSGGHDLQNINIPVEVSRTAPKNLVGKPYEIQNQNFDFDFCTPQTLILFIRSIFLRGGHLKKYGVKNNFS
jgi:hypothetical protein